MSYFLITILLFIYLSLISIKIEKKMSKNVVSLEKSWMHVLICFVVLVVILIILYNYISNINSFFQLLQFYIFYKCILIKYIKYLFLKIYFFFYFETINFYNFSLYRMKKKVLIKAHELNRLCFIYLGFDFFLYEKKIVFFFFKSFLSLFLIFILGIRSYIYLDIFFSFFYFYFFSMEDQYDGLVNNTFLRSPIILTEKGKDNLLNYGFFLITNNKIKKKLSSNIDYIFLCPEE